VAVKEDLANGIRIRLGRPLGSSALTIHDCFIVRGQ